MNMKKIIFTALAAGMPLMLFAQGAINAYQVSQNELRGTARFMSMGGAFGALGGDLSTMRQNPAGIGVYRRSEVGLTLDIDIQGSKFMSMGQSANSSQTKVACDNFGYVGAVRLDNDLMPYFQWGVSYGRAMSFDRVYQGSIPSLSTSLSNYVANFSGDYSMGALIGNDTYDPFFDSNVSWMSALAANTYMINPVGVNPGNQARYEGLFGAGSSGDATVNVRERGYVDEYTINFGGNFANTVYWGLGFGITDLSFTQDSYYDEQIDNARIVNQEGNGISSVPGSAYFGLDNYQSVSGTGFNVKFGLIFKPVNEFRLGFAVHSPTWYSLTYNTNAWVDYVYDGYDPANSQDYFYTNMPSESPDYYDNPYATSGQGYFDANIRTPWRIMVSAAGVVGGRAILSADYEYEAYNNMTVGDATGTFDDVTGDIKTYYQATNTLRLGAEFRVTPQLSLRAGYSYKSSPVKQAAYDNQEYVYTTGTNPMYTFDNSIQYVTCGIGYRFGGFYVDAAYVHKHRESRWSAFTRFDGNDVPSAKITDNNNHIVMSVGYKF